MAKSSGDPAWLKSMKREAERLGIPLRELLTRSIKPGAAPKPKAKAKPKTMAAAKGGAMMKKKGYAKGGYAKGGAPEMGLPQIRAAAKAKGYKLVKV